MINTAITRMVRERDRKKQKKTILPKLGAEYKKILVKTDSGVIKISAAETDSGDFVTYRGNMMIIPLQYGEYSFAYVSDEKEYIKKYNY